MPRAFGRFTDTKLKIAGNPYDEGATAGVASGSGGN